MRIAIFAGPSGGHLFPAQAFSESLRRLSPNTRLHLITSRKAEGLVRQMDPALFEKVVYLPEFPLPSGISLRTLDFLLQLARAFFISYFYLRRSRPALSVGFGSYASYPGLWLSCKMKVPTMIHEQNLVPGTATDRLKRDVDLLAVSFPETYAEAELSHRRVVGLPVRSSLRESVLHRPSKKSPNPRGDRFRILIVGGSQGAHRLNRAALSTFSRFTPEEKRKLAVIHITGNRDCEEVRQVYRSLEVEAEIYSFSNRMNEHYQRANLALTRAGANTLFELALYELPAIVVPYPHAGAHQRANARAFETRGGIVCREEKDLSEDWLSEKIRHYRDHPDALEHHRENLKKLATPRAADELADLALTLIFKREEMCAPSLKI